MQWGFYFVWLEIVLCLDRKKKEVFLLVKSLLRSWHTEIFINSGYLFIAGNYVLFCSEYIRELLPGLQKDPSRASIVHIFLLIFSYFPTDA